MQNRAMALEFTTSYLADSITLLRYYKKLGDQAMAQVSDDGLTAALDAESNSIAIIVKHLAGNMRSRWTDFLVSDGEKPDRNRDDEFRAAPQTRAEITAMWEASWKIVFETLVPLTDADLGRTIRIRNEPHSVMQAINRQVAHYAYDFADRAARQIFRLQRSRGIWKGLAALGLALLAIRPIQPRGRTTPFPDFSRCRASLVRIALHGESRAVRGFGR
jgi:hypothetical protein